jgi:hypothetical protein
LLGIVTYSNPRHAALIAPLALLPLWRRQISWAVTVGAIALSSLGAVRRQRGDIGRVQLPGRRSENVLRALSVRCARRVAGIAAARRDHDTGTPQEVLTSSELPLRFAHNVQYFPRRTAFWLRSVLLPRRRCHRGVAAVGRRAAIAGAS